MTRRTVAVIVPSLARGGGIPALADFLCDTIETSESFDYRLFSVPSSSRDAASVRLTVPSTWLRGPIVEDAVWLNRPYQHVGAVLAELEFQRYRPRRALTHRLRECDLIHVVAGNPAWGLIAGTANRPVALHVATLAAVEREERFRQEGGLVTAWRRLMTKITVRLDREAIQAADRLLVLNPWMKRTIDSWTAPQKVVLAPPGIDVDYFHPEPQPSNRGAPYILSVGRFQDRRKNISLLFEAYAELRKSHPESPTLVLVGKTGPREEDWTHARELGVREQIAFHEDVSRSELADYYRGALLFVLSSSEEGLGLVILEAMASGLPVVSTATQGAREAVEDRKTGLLTPIGDAKALGKAMGRLLGDADLLREMGRQGRIRAVDRYSNEAAGCRFLECYRELLEREGTETKSIAQEQVSDPSRP